MPDPTLNLLINEEQYNFLNTERATLDEFNAVGSLRNLDIAYLTGCANIHQMIYNGPRPTVNCRDCIMAMLRPLIYQINLYEHKNS